MNIAFLFNSDHERFHGHYGSPIMESILRTGVLQAANRNMRISVGDILTFMTVSKSRTPTYDQLEKLCRSVYSPTNYDNLILERLEPTYSTATVYCWLFQNMNSNHANELHCALLKSEPAYLGAMDVIFSEATHLQFFRNSLIESYRLQKNHCSIFYSMSENEDPDQEKNEIFERYGYTVEFEDIGARGTIFDNYDSLAHFQRVEDFRDYFARFQGDIANDVVHLLEELHPKLFDAFAAAARTLKRAETEEDLAQVSLSGRRLLEKISNHLYPPSAEKYNGRKIGNAEYKNRLWAYIETTINETNTDQQQVAYLGKKTDKLIETFNSGLHSDLQKSDIESAFCELMIWISELVELSPSKARRPYLAYEDEIIDFTKSILNT